jgi:hypothetical protein
LIAPLPGATVTGLPTFSWHAAADQREDPHFYKLHVTGPGVDLWERTEDTTFTLLTNPGFQEGQTYAWTVWITDEFTSVRSQDAYEFTYSVFTHATSDNAPQAFHLGQNYPNPFNSSTVIPVTVGSRSHVSLRVCDLLGQEITTLVDGPLEQGIHSITWNPGEASTGVYIVRLQAGAYTAARKLILQR